MSNVPVPPPRITHATLLNACQRLAQRDSDLAGVLRLYGPPPLWGRSPGFPTLVRIILEQQVSLVSAQAALARLVAQAGPLSPERVLALGTVRLREAGLTRQKTRYVLDLADRIHRGALDLRHVSRASDDEARSMLCEVTGIGAWTAEVYLVMALRRPDIWPTDDLALAKAVQQLKRRLRVPSEASVQRIAGAWRPWRSVAARMVWHFYLSRLREARPRSTASGTARRARSAAD